MKQDLKAVWFSLTLAAFTFVFGFVAMLVLWKTVGSDYTGERGLFSYQAATWGDGLFLSILVGSSLMYILLGPSLSNVQKYCCFSIGVITTILGVLIQFSWLESDTIILNWTIPSLHHFNIAGRYHAVYFFLMFGLIGALIACIACSRFQNRKYNESPSRLLVHGLIWFSGSGYFFVHIIDDWQNVFRNTLGIIFSIISVLLVAAVFSMISSSKIRIISDIHSILIGVLFSFGICAIIADSVDKYQIGSLSFVMMYALLAVAIILPNPQNRRESILQLIRIVASAFGLGVLIDSIPNPNISVIISIISIPVLLFITFSQNDDNKNDRFSTIFTGIALFIALGFYSLLLRNDVSWICKLIIQDTWRDIVEGAVYIVILITLSARVNGLFEIIRNAEKQWVENKTHESRKLIHAAQLLVYLVWVPIITLGFILLVLGTIYLERDFNPSVFGFWEAPTISLFSLLLIILSMLTVLIMIAIGIYNKLIARRICPCLLLLSYVLLFIYISELRRPLLLSFIDVLLFFIVLGSSAFIANGFITNLRFIRGIVNDDRTYRFNVIGRIAHGIKSRQEFSLSLTTIIIFIGSTFVFVGSILPTKDSDGLVLPSITSPLIGIIGCFVATVLLPILAAWIYREDKSILPKQMLVNTPVLGVLQDSVMAWIMVMFGGMFVFHFYQTDIKVVIKIFEVAFTVAVAIEFSLKNNEYHLNDYTSKEIFNPAYKSAITSDDRRNIILQQAELKSHLERQAVVVVWTLLPWTIFYLFLRWALYTVAGSYDEKSKKRVRVKFAKWLYDNYLFEVFGNQYRLENDYVLESGRNAEESIV